MKASELITELQKLVANQGDLDVRLYTDHGQCSMSADFVSISYIQEDEYMADIIAQEDLDEYDNPIMVIEIQA